MIRPLDMQTAFHALPEIAQSRGAEQAGALYRQVHELSRAYQENLERHERLVQVENRPETVFHPVEPRREDSGASRDRNRRSQRRAREELSSEKLYAPRGSSLFKIAYTRENSGVNLDIVA